CARGVGYSSYYFDYW
nr:immunoglobulin heavy chain junction region [Mus musculus]MBK4186264.1 immunoglobulin heavy chain junction region [Mus musculus]